MSDEMDPEIAALIGDVQEYKPSGERPKSAAPPGGGPGTPDFDTLFGGLDSGGETHGRGEYGVDLTRKGFAPITKFEEEQPADFFSDPEFYKKALAGEGDEATKVHELLGKFMKAADPKDRGIYRQQLIMSFWYLSAKAALHSIQTGVPLPKRLLVRFGALLPSLLSPEIKDVIQRVVFEKTIDEPVYYVDEWMKAVATGQVKASATDEVKTSKGDERAKFNAMLQKAQGRRDAAEGILKGRADERKTLEAILTTKVEEIRMHASHPGLLHVPAPYTDAQKKIPGEVMDLLRRMIAADKTLAASIEDFQKANEDLESAREKSQGIEGDTKADLQTVAQE
ncbi:MAG: hypothetical protein WCL50_01120, partial [Spirochaetota bacterium]